MFLFDEEGGTNGKISDLEAWEKPIRFHPPPRKKYVLTYLHLREFISLSRIFLPTDLHISSSKYLFVERCIR